MSGWRMAVICGACGGYGDIRWLASPPDPQTEESATCPECNGEGVVDGAPKPADGLVDDIPL